MIGNRCEACEQSEPTCLFWGPLGTVSAVVRRSLDSIDNFRHSSRPGSTAWGVVSCLNLENLTDANNKKGLGEHVVGIGLVRAKI